MVDLGGREPGDLYRRVQQDQFLKLNLQRIEIPLPLFGEAVDGKPQDTLFVWIQMLNAHARDSIEAQLLGCRVARFAVNELVAASDQERVAETEEANRGRDLSHMSGIKLAQLPGGGPKLFQGNVGKLQARDVVASSMRRGCERHPLLAFASAAALPPQLGAKSCAGCSRIKGVGHWYPALLIVQKQQINTTEMNVVDPVGPSGPPARRQRVRRADFTRTGRVRNRRK